MLQGIFITTLTYIIGFITAMHSRKAPVKNILLSLNCISLYRQIVDEYFSGSRSKEFLYLLNLWDRNYASQDYLAYFVESKVVRVVSK